MSRAPAAPTPWHVVDGVDEAVDLAGRHGDVLVVDLENTVVDYGSTPEQRHDAMVAVLDTAAAGGVLRRVAFVSNARFRLDTPTHGMLAVHALAAARKPYVRLPPLRHLRTELAGAAVYGDQPLTDGRLARNLGGIWLQPRHAHQPDPEEPWWPRVMRRRGRRVARRDFRLATPAGGAPPTA